MRLRQEVQFEQQEAKRSKDSVLDQLAAEYEERLVESKMMARTLSSQNQKMIEQVRDQNRHIDDLNERIQGLEQELQ